MGWLDSNESETEHHVALAGVCLCGYGYERGQYGDFLYTTKGESKIERWRAETYSSIPSAVANSYMAIGHGHYEAEPTLLPQAQGWHEVVATKEPTKENTAIYEVIVTALSGKEAYSSGFFHSEITLQQEAPPHVSLNTTEETVNGEQNALYGSRWASANAGKWAIGTSASDPGLGISSSTAKSPNAAKWSSTVAGWCNGAQCHTPVTPTLPLKGATEQLPDGEDSVEVKVKDPVGLEASTGLATVKIDNTAPHGITLSGLDAGNQIGEREYSLKVEASDGAGTTKSSGMQSIAVAIDGKELGTPTGSCSLGPCTANGEWELNGADYGAGEHKLKVTATDKAGNVATSEVSLKVHHAAPVALGPGAVGPLSGEFSMSATDASVSSPGAGLSVSRTYYSRHLKAGLGGKLVGPLGPQWSLSVGGQESITRSSSTTAVTLSSATGGQTTFTSSGGGNFTSPKGDANLKLTEVKNEKGELTEYLLKNATNAATTRFTSTSGPTATVWKPTKQEGPLGAQTVRYLFESAEGEIRPTYALAPEPAGLGFSCMTKLEKSEKLEKGCRALAFKYSSTTAATGESRSEWNDYKARLKEVLLVAYNPATKAMAEIPVAQYAYDGKGRLRAEWNPQVSPALKTTYGYDAEGHVTAVSAAGQQPWLLHYGTLVGDLNTGRLLSVIRSPASTELGSGTAPTNTASPTLSSTSPKVGAKISVSTNGSWSNAPLSYAYQWEDCNAVGAECALIAGAVNQSYYPVKSDEGRTLVALVTAINATGSTVAASSATSTVATGTPSTPLPEPPNPGTSAVWTVDYQVPLSGSELQTMTKSELEKWGQTDDPTEAMAIFPPDKPMGWPAKEYKRATILYLDSKDRAVNSVTPAGGVSTTEYNETNDIVRTLSADDRAAALKELNSAEAANLLDSKSTYNETGSEPGTQLLSTLGPQHTVKLSNGTQVQARAHTVFSYNEGAPAEGGPYRLVTKTTQGAQYAGKEEDVRTTLTSYSGQENLGWKLREPTSVTVDPTGLDLIHTIVYEKETGQIAETRLPGNPTAKSPHATETIYYSAGTESKLVACRSHPEWANLPCQTQPAKQPETAGLPKLPVTTYNAYSIYDAPEKSTDTVEGKTRVKTSTYDNAGRLVSTSISSSVGSSLPPVTNVYNATTGAPEKQTAESKELTSHYNTLGQLESYTDASGSSSTYEYDIDGRVTKLDDGKGTESYIYNATTGLPSELRNEYGTTKLTFTASTDAEGNVVSETYPNGMSANYGYDATGMATGLEYKKTTNCTEKCTWFSDAVVPSIHGQWLEQTSSLSHQAITYDAAGRLTQVQSTPAGQGCTTRIYAYEADTNRTNLTTREPNAKGECTGEGGAEEKHTYDEADRLTDAGTAFNAFGDITALPAKDAGGKEPSEELTSAYYTDDQLASQTQSGETVGYTLDPSGRTLETIATGKTVANTTLHYAGSSSAPAWTSNTSGETSRNIAGIAGQLDAVQNNVEAPVLELKNLHGDVVASASLSETATALISTADTSEYGVPTGSPSKYSWLGAVGLRTETPSGVVAMGARSYVPELGRFLQPDPVAGGSADAYSYTYGDPINSFDPSGALTESVLELIAGHAGEVGAAAQAQEEAEIAQRRAEEAAQRAAEEASARREAESAAISASWASWWAGYYASLSAPVSAGGGGGTSGLGGGGCTGTGACIAGSGHGWVCTLGGAVVAAGVTVLTAGITGIIAGGAFTAGCEFSQSHNPTYDSGLPTSGHSGCWNVWTQSKRTHQFTHRSEECYA